MVDIDIGEGDDIDVPLIQYREFTDKKVLEEGTYCVIYSARHPTFGRCCLRIFSKYFLVREGMNSRLTRDVNKLAAIRHRNIVRIMGYVMENQRLCQIQPLYDYGSLDQAMMRISIPWGLKTRMAWEVSDALCFLHDYNPQIIYKRLKTSNVLVDGNFSVQISDILFDKNDSWMMQATQMKDITDRQKQARGDMSMYDKPGWVIAHVAPENIRNINCRGTPAYDVYSFGVLLWEMMANSKPYPGLKTDKVYEAVIQGRLLSTDGLRSDRPQYLSDIMISTLTLQPEQRPRMHSLRTALHNHFDRQQCDCDVQIAKHQYESWMAQREQLREARRQAEQEAREIAARQAIPVHIQSARPVVPTRDEVAQRAIHMQVSQTIEHTPPNQVAAPESEGGENENRNSQHQRRSDIAHPTPTILVNPQPARNVPAPATPTVYVDLNSTRPREIVAQPTPTIFVNPPQAGATQPPQQHQSRRIAQPTPTIFVNPQPADPEDPPQPQAPNLRPMRIVQPTPTILVHPQPAEPEEPAQLEQGPSFRPQRIAQPTPTIFVNPQPAEPEEPAQMEQGPSFRPRRIAQPTPTIFVNPQPAAAALPEPMETSQEQPASLQRNPIAQPTPTVYVSLQSEAEEPVQAPEPNPAEVQQSPMEPDVPEVQPLVPDQPSPSEPVVQLPQDQPMSQTTEPAAVETAGSSSNPAAGSSSQSGSESKPKRRKPKYTREQINTPALTIMYDPEEYRQRREAALQCPFEESAIDEEETEINEQEERDDCATPFADTTGLQNDRPFPAQNRGYFPPRALPEQVRTRQSLPAARDSYRALSRTDMDIVAHNIGSNWKRLARQMQLPDGTIDAINHDYDRDGLYEKAYQSILRWQTIQGSQVPVSRMVSILLGMEAMGIAHKLEP